MIYLICTGKAQVLRRNIIFEYNDEQNVQITSFPRKKIESSFTPEQRAQKARDNAKRYYERKKQEKTHTKM